MKILFLTTHLNTGGITSYLYTLTRYLVRAGNQVVVISSGGDREPDFENIGARHLRIDIRTKSELSPKIYFSLTAVVDNIKKENVDVIHSHTRVTQVLGVLASRLSGKPHMSTCHGFFKTRISRRMFPCWGRAVIAISQPVEDHLKNDFKVPAGTVHLIPNGIDVDSFAGPVDKERCKAQMGFGNRPVIGIIARLSDVKGHDVLIRALTAVLVDVPEALLVIVGCGPQESYLKQLVEKYSLAASVIFMPVVNKTIDILPGFDVFVMPSLQEGLGLSLMEAQAAALPVVGSSVGGLKQIIKDKETGLLVAPGDEAQVAEAIVHMLKDKDGAVAMGRRAREFIRENFSMEKMGTQTAAVYQEVINRNA